MAHCKRCNSYMLFSSSSGYCRNCNKAIKQKVKEDSRNRNELLQSIDKNARKKAEEAYQNMSESDRLLAEFTYNYLYHPNREQEKVKQPQPKPKPVFRNETCEFPYGDDPECSRGEVDISLSAEEEERIYNHAKGNVLEYVNPLKDIYEKVLNELIENMLSGYRQMGRIQQFRQQYAKNSNEPDESIAARVLLDKKIVIGIPYKLRK